MDLTLRIETASQYGKNGCRLYSSCEQPDDALPEDPVVLGGLMLRVAIDFDLLASRERHTNTGGHQTDHGAPAQFCQDSWRQGAGSHANPAISAYFSELVSGALDGYDD